MCQVAYFMCQVAYLELPSIGWQLFILGSSPRDQTALPSLLATYTTRLLTEPLSLVVVALVVLDGHSVGVPRPDTYRSPTGVVVVRSVVVGDAALDGCAIDVAEHHAAAVVVGAAAANVDVLVCPAVRRGGEVPEGLDACVGAVVGRYVCNPDVPEAALGAVRRVGAQEDARITKAADLDVSDANVPKFG